MAYKNKNKQKQYQKTWLQSKRKEWQNVMHNLKINGCAICGKQPIETHHENYGLWYVFIPLCRKCHLNIGVNKL